MGWDQAGQTEIDGDSLGGGQSDMGCDWCDDPAVGSVERKRKIKGKKEGFLPTGQRHYFCEKHRRLANTTATNGGRGW